MKIHGNEELEVSWSPKGLETESGKGPGAQLLHSPCRTLAMAACSIPRLQPTSVSSLVTVCTRVSSTTVSARIGGIWLAYWGQLYTARLVSCGQHRRDFTTYQAHLYIGKESSQKWRFGLAYIQCNLIKQVLFIHHAFTEDLLLFQVERRTEVLAF